MIKIKRGLDLPITGAPRQEIDGAPSVKQVAILGGEYHGMRPTMEVAEGDRVIKGQLIFTDKKTEGVKYTAPATGTVVAINRGKRRALQSVVIDVEQGSDEAVQFQAYKADEISALSREVVVQQLVDSGQWTTIRTRPFGKVPALDSQPHSIFVTAMDTNPLAANPDVIIAKHEQAFRNGLAVLSRLTPGVVWVCRSPESTLASFAGGQVREQRFAGPHPAGNAGTHIHYLDPVGMQKTVWSLGYQEVIAIGKLFTTGELFVERIVALAGPQVKDPRLVRTQVGADLASLTAGELKDGENRIISGSVFNGHNARGPIAYLGRNANQVTVLLEGRERVMFGYLSPGVKRHSVMGIYLSKLTPGRKLDMTASTNGSERAMVPIGNYEKVMPLDILPTHLLRAIIVGDTDTAQDLGALELVEEDLALCTYVCVGKYEYGPLLRDTLTTIELEG